MRDPKIPPLDPWLVTLVEREKARGRTPATAKEAAYAQIHEKLALLQASAPNSSASSTAKGGLASAAKASTAAKTALLLTKLTALASLAGALAASAIALTPDAPPLANRPVVSAQAATASEVGDRGIAIEVAASPAPSAQPAPDPSTKSLVPITDDRKASLPANLHESPRSAESARPHATTNVQRSAVVSPVESVASAGPGRAHVPTSDDGDLAEERHLLDHAQRVLAHRDPTLALADVEAHARRFPNGQLKAEREAIAIRALVLAGRIGEARVRAQRFRAEFPNSLFGPVVDSVVGKEK